MTTNTPENFYVTGGTLHGDTRSYIPRQADQDLYDGLRQGQFCYVLNSRQMGKSSLMNQTADKLKAEGVAVATLDLTGIGQNLTPEQWYDGLLGQLGDDLNLTDELDAFWQAHERLGPLDRWMRAVREVVLARCAGQIVIFVDEIDVVRSLPFSTDEFFAAIRECYNRRTENPELERLTFCLLGVATPSDLIRDTRTTPFNIGRRIELNDFTAAEAAPLTEGLGCDERTAQKLLTRILYWTGGHPHLTQRLCQAVAADAAVTNAGGVDRLCEELFLTTRARGTDDNLADVGKRMLPRKEEDRAGLLDLYTQVRNQKRIRNDEANPLISVLRLSGVTRVTEGLLYVRNQIYYRVFDREWVLANMPDAELRRQQAAYRRGLLRAAAIAAVIVLAFGALTVLAFQQRNRADLNQRQAEMNAQQAKEQTNIAEGQRTMAQQAQLEAEKQKTAAEEQRQMAERQTQEAMVQKTSAEAQRNRALQQEYSARMILANQAFQSEDFAQADNLLNAHLPQPGQPDIRGFEWYYLWRNFHQESATFSGHTGHVASVAFSPDGKTLASGSGDETIKLWSVATGQPLATLSGHTDSVDSVAFSPDGKTLVSGSFGTIKLWNVTTGQPLATLSGHTGIVDSVAFSPDGRTLASGSGDETIKLWSVATGQPLATLSGNASLVYSVAFSPDGKTLVSGSDDNTIKLWNVATGQPLATLSGHTGSVYSVAFSPDGKTLVSGSDDKTIKLWNVVTGQPLATLSGHTDSVLSVAFSPDGRTLASGNGRTLAPGSGDNIIRLWNVATGQLLATLSGHTSRVNSVAFSPDGKTLASGSFDNTIRLWRAATEEEVQRTMRREQAGQR